MKDFNGGILRRIWEGTSVIIRGTECEVMLYREETLLVVTTRSLS